MLCFWHMPPVSEQPNPVPLQPASPSIAIKAIRIFLLVLIVIGFGLIATEKLWVPKLVNAILQNQMSGISPAILSTTPSSSNGNQIPAATFAEWVRLGTKQNSDYTENGGTIYCKGVPVASADVSTFLISAATSANDAPYAILNVDAFAKDKNHVYVCHEGGPDPDPQYNVPGPAIVDSADPATFTLVFDSLDYFADFAKDKNHVYAVTWGNANIFEGAATSSFISLGGADPFDSFFKDKSHVYTWSGVVSGADPNTFSVIVEATSSRAVYGKDANHVFYANGRGAQLISGADPATFVVLDSNGYYAKDASHVYRLGSVQTGVVSVVPGVDPATFVPPSSN